MDERTAIERLKQGDIGGLEFLVRTYQSEALRAANLVTGDKALAEDVVQDAFLQAYERVETFDADRPFGPWFRRCVINLALRATSRQARQVAIGLEGDQPAARLTSSEPGPEEIVASLEDATSVRKALDRLTPDQRAAIVLRYYGGLTDREAAAELGRPTGTIQWWIYAARQRLRTLLHPLRSHPEISTKLCDHRKDES